MNSKQRVLKTLNGEIPDRVPVAEFAVDYDTVEKILGRKTYLRAKASSQIACWENRHDEVAESYLKDHIELHEKLELDIVTFPMATWQLPAQTDDPPPRKIDDSTWEDKYGRIYKYSPVTADITCIRDPVMDQWVFSIDEFEKLPDVAAPDERSWQIVDGVVQRFKHEKFICSPDGGEIGIVMLGGMERGLMELIENPQLIHAATAHFLETQNLSDEKYIHPEADAVLWGADFGYKSGPFISPTMFRDYFLEPNKARVKNLHQKFGIKVLKHCCGNVMPLMDFFIEIGYDAYQSIQATAGMDICELKKSYGDKITLWGGVSLEHLISGSQDDVRQDVRRAMNCAKPGGRFILGTSHSVAVGSNYDNYMAMLDEYHRWCDY
ncbi:MAG: uroporphyrinogen decarboxylase family protein [bacterium]|nr:uroporphyrinogen decarboxylase family protein [bacterium]